jgi:hypothetical protein
VSNGQEETHQLIHHLKDSGFRFEKMPSEEELEEKAQKFANEQLVKHLGKRMMKAIDSNKLLLRLAAKYVYTKT